MIIALNIKLRHLYFWRLLPALICKQKPCVCQGTLLIIIAHCPLLLTLWETLDFSISHAYAILWNRCLTLVLHKQSLNHSKANDVVIHKIGRTSPLCLFLLTVNPSEDAFMGCCLSLHCNVHALKQASLVYILQYTSLRPTVLPAGVISSCNLWLSSTDYLCMHQGNGEAAAWNSKNCNGWLAMCTLDCESLCGSENRVQLWGTLGSTIHSKQECPEKVTF